MKHTLVFFVLLLSQILFGQNYKQVKVYYNSYDQIVKLMGAGFALDDAYFNKDNSLSIFLTDSGLDKLKGMNLNYDILIDDWFEYYKSIPVLTEAEKENALEESRQNFGVEGFGYGSMGGFYTFTEVVNKLDSMAILYPEIITSKFSLGNSHNGNPIWAVKISDNPNINENEPQVFFDALIHAREPQSMATVMYFMYYLLENYGTNPEVTYLVNNREIYFVPVFNPDGYEYNRQTNPNGGGMWRLNRRNNGGSYQYGVDLNRNFGYMWGYDNTGSSNYPGDETYRGPSAFSEPECQAVRDFVLTKNIKTHINYHSYGNYIIYPWGYINQLTPDSETYIEYASYMSRFNGFNYGNSSQMLGYESNGTVRDWMYGEQTSKGKIYSYVFEVGSSSDYFWPPQSRIFPLAQLNVRPNLFKCWIAGEYVSFDGAEYNQQYFNPGDVIQMFPAIKNQGLSTGHNITVTLTSLSPDVVINSGTIVIDSIQARARIELTYPFVFSIVHLPTPSPIIKLVVATSLSEVEMSRDTVSLKLGVPMYAFIDTTNNINSLWTITASPSTPKWDVTVSSFYSSPNSYTDSPSGNYVANATVTMTTTNPVNLSNMNEPTLTFWTKHDIETKWDCSVIQISTNNGTTWNNLTGTLSKAASGSGRQTPSGMPIYDGVLSNWTQEEISLSAYTGQQVKLRFELRTDGSQQRDGWYIDDIGIVTYNIIPVELSALSAKVLGNSVIIEWTTASELNNRGFEIQRKVKENVSDWKTLAFIRGNGSSSEIHNYSFKDENPIAGKILYRLKQIDHDGSVKIFNELEIDFAGVYSFSLGQNYPNPFNPVTTIRFSVPSPSLAAGRRETSDVKLVVYDVMGREVSTLVNEKKEPGTYEVKFDAAQLTSGVYFYRLTSGDFIDTKKLILIR